MKKTLAQQLSQIVGTQHVRCDAESLRLYGVDRTTQWSAAPAAIVFPETTEQVQQLVQLANSTPFVIVPSGGRTGLSGGAVAANGEIVVSMDRMNAILEVNSVEQTIRCQAGVITRQLQDVAKNNGLYYPVDFASSGSSQLGGNIATNAGGIKVIRYGSTRSWVRGLTVVTGNGKLLNLNKGLIKNNAGYDLRHLFIGSEGTLGLICEATVQLTRQPKDLQVMVLAVREFDDVLKILESFNNSLELTAFEFFSDRGLQEVTQAGVAPRPFTARTPFYVLLEYDCVSSSVVENAEKAFELCLNKGWIKDGVVSQTQMQAQNLWKLRECLSEMLAQYKPYKSDLSVRTSLIPKFTEAVEKTVARYCGDTEIVWFGHIGDGNLHLNILNPPLLPQEKFLQQCRSFSSELAVIVQDFGGSISAEHGIGLLKRDYLLSTCSDAEVDIMRQIKRTFDPKGILNPGKIFQ